MFHKKSNFQRAIISILMAVILIPLGAYAVLNENRIAYQISGPIGHLIISEERASCGIYRIYGEADEEILTVGIGMLGGTAKFGDGGNTVLLGNYTDAQFKGIDKLQDGHIVEIRTVGQRQIFKYEVIEIVTFSKDDASWIQGQPNKSTLSLVTVLPSGEKIYVLCDLVGTELKYKIRYPLSL